MKGVLLHARTYIFRGLLAIIPLGLTYFVLRFLYVTIDKRITAVLERIIGFSIPGLGIMLLLATLYLLGVVASNVLGKQMFGLLERIADRIPLVKTTYHVGKQLAVTLSLPEKHVFERPVLVEYLRPGMWAIGFVTGTVSQREKNGEKLLKVFIPTSPNPTTGLLVVLKASQTREPGWTLEEAMNAVISGGILGPADITGTGTISERTSNRVGDEKDIGREDVKDEQR